MEKTKKSLGKIWAERLLEKIEESERAKKKGELEKLIKIYKEGIEFWGMIIKAKVNKENNKKILQWANGVRAICKDIEELIQRL